MNKTQKKIAIQGEKLPALLLGPGEHGRVVPSEGIKGKELNENQKELLLELIKTRLGFINKDDYLAKMNIIVAELDETYFAWWGPQK